MYQFVLAHEAHLIQILCPLLRCWIIWYWLSKVENYNEAIKIEVNTNLLFRAVVVLIAVPIATLWSI